MQVRERQRSGEPSANTMDAGRTTVAPDGRRARSLGITATEAIEAAREALSFFDHT